MINLRTIVRKATLPVLIIGGLTYLFWPNQNVERFTVDGSFRDFPARAISAANGKTIALNNIGDGDRAPADRSGVKGIDRNNHLNNLDGFEEIRMYGLSEGNPLLAYSNPESLRLAYETVVANAEGEK